MFIIGFLVFTIGFELGWYSKAFSTPAPIQKMEFVDTNTMWENFKKSDNCLSGVATSTRTVRTFSSEGGTSVINTGDSYQACKTGNYIF